LGLGGDVMVALTEVEVREVVMLRNAIKEVFPFRRRPRHPLFLASSSFPLLFGFYLESAYGFYN